MAWGSLGEDFRSMFRNLYETLCKRPKQINAIPYKNLFLPTHRTNQGLTDDEAYLASGVDQINFLTETKILREKSIILDFGCGQGRLINSLRYADKRFGHYWGLDTDKSSIRWCKKFLRYSPNIEFIHLPAYNARYSPRQSGRRVFPKRVDGCDLIFANSVSFSHA